jgi:uncharacterized protein with NAD-binding domain and iron-sulfur cluster
MTQPRPRVAILGGGMSGMAAAWRLSEPGWRDRFESVTVYQRGWRLGGKGASSRGVHGRIEEHGLHVWLGWYDNAFRLLRECYDELDRARTDPAAPIATWRQALRPSSDIGLAGLDHEAWQHWLARFSPNDLEPGDPRLDESAITAADYLRRGLRLIVDFVESLAGSRDGVGSPSATVSAGVRVLVPGVVLEATRVARELVAHDAAAGRDDELVEALDELQARLSAAVDAEPDLKRTWQQVGLTIAVLRGLVADRALRDPRRFEDLDDEDFRDWIRRHGAVPDVVDGPFVRGIYDLVFADEDGDPTRPGFGAATGLLLASKMLFEYRGAIFWKMAAGMGDVVFAPLYQAMRLRGVDFTFFSRVDALHLSADRSAVESVSLGRQVRLAPGVEQYDPLIRVRGLPCFPARPLVEQVDPADAGAAVAPLESHWCDWPDAEPHVLRRGVDFDHLVLALPVGMAPTVCGELIADRPEWRDMVDNVATVATRAVQLWLADDEGQLGWPVPGSTLTGFSDPFDTGASMSHVLDAEDWPDDGSIGGPNGDRPRSVIYFCDTHAPAPPDGHGAAYPELERRRVCEQAGLFLDGPVGRLLPGAMEDGGFRWDLLCGAGGATGAAAVATQFATANVDPSDRYVQSRPGTGRYRLRPDESGYDNLVLAGDWTDSGINAGCIEAAVVSGLQAANAVLGRARHHRVVGRFF